MEFWTLTTFIMTGGPKLLMKDAPPGIATLVPSSGTIKNGTRHSINELNQDCLKKTWETMASDMKDALINTPISPPHSRASLDWTRFGTSHRRLIRFGSGEFEGRSTPWALCQFPGPCLSGFCSVSGRIVLKGRAKITARLPSGRAVVTGGVCMSSGIHMNTSTTKVFKQNISLYGVD